MSLLLRNKRDDGEKIVEAQVDDKCRLTGEIDDCCGRVKGEDSVKLCDGMMSGCRYKLDIL